ncbi:MAG: Rieske 2Fe-2S domain-containing protein [Nitriliruptorales bacterium]|nr:Rieske 2Fe-2S domain-containing protein [Nitriliruptorales bacterium]
MTTILWVLATAIGLLAVGFWWIRRNNLAVYPAGRAPRELRPLNTGCELGAQIMMATTAESAGGTTGTRSSGASPAAPGPAALKRRKKTPGPPRREFLRTGLLVVVGGMLASFGGASLAFLWPTLKGGFGAQIDVGDEGEITQAIRDGGGRFEFPSGRSYLVAYDPGLDPDGQYAEITNGAPFMALYQKCVHLGCRVPWCESSKWFECPCHGSRYNRWGEYQFGPAPRGLDRFAVRVEEGRVVVDTSTVVTGPSRTGGALKQPPEGPHCN